jgi:hypothetical protein
MSEQTIIDPESAVIGMKLGAALALTYAIERSTEGNITDFAKQAADNIRDVLDILNIEVD